MLTIFRRHMKDCKFTSRKNRNCQCPIAVEGMLHGRLIRKSLDVRSWEAAQKIVRDWEANPEQGGGVTVRGACEKFIDDAVFRNLSEGMIRKLKNVTNELTEKFGAVPIRSITRDDMAAFMKGWKALAPITKQKRLEMLRNFFSFCDAWIDKDPTRKTRIIVKHKPTLPFTEEQMEKILWAADTVREIHPQMNEGIEKKMRALILLMRHSGLRISDAVTLTPDRIKNGKLFLYQAKTEEPVWVPLPEIVTKILEEIREPGRAYYFWTGNGKLRHAPTEWQDRLKKVFLIAGIPDGHSHRFRDTFAVSLLEKGVLLETVSMLLGHTSLKTTEKHYAPWVKSRQVALEQAIQATFA